MKAWIKAEIKRRGFTLIELLIVVAIIGVLSTIAIPTFKKMVSKSKKSEAKVALGALYTAEAAFYSEYTVYGNLLQTIGVDDPNTSFYSVGFPNAASSCANSTTALPSSGAGLASLNAVLPSYYTSFVAGTSSTVYLSNPAALPSSGAKCYFVATSVTGAAGSTFLATASGPIASGATVTSQSTGPVGCSSSNVCQDAWTMTQARDLNNPIDGAQF